jgi:signal transduction histidine kinase
VEEAELPCDEAARFQAALDNLDQGVCMFDTALRLQACNRRFVDLLGLPDILVGAGTPFADLLRYLVARGDLGHGPVDDLVARRVEAAQRGARFYSERTTPDGRMLGMRCSPLPTGGFVLVYTDITERRQQEVFTVERHNELEARVNQQIVELRTVNEELRANLRRLEEESAARAKEEQRAERALHEAQKMSAIGQLAGGLAHDFNNLLTIIVGNLRALETRIDGELAQEFVAPAVRASHRGVDITRRLLAFARQQSLEPSPVDVPATIAATAQLLRRSLPSSIAIDCSAARPGWPALVDPAQLENAIVNLALNARDAMPDGGRLAFTTADERVSDDPRLSPGDYVSITVCDDGAGIAPELLSRVLEPFFTTKPFGSGSGLGLSMVFGFVRQSRGDLRIVSEPGKGTAVTLLLPRAEEAVPVVDDTTPVALTVDGRDQLVLLVEDDADVRHAVRRQLLELGYQVLEARDGEDAQSLLAAASPISALVSDVIMPGAVNGLGLAAEARRLVPGIRIVLMSGFADVAASGHDWFHEKLLLRKPFDKEELARALLRGGA